MANDLISNMSYTSKDFNTIYPELLDLVKKITYKWDPSISNESDPGVVLLKLNALIADKCNYNIDKNVLECFPLSVTQESNARQLYDQLGYHMKWYRSATAKVTLTWINFDSYEKSSVDRVIIPKFSMITDSDNSIVYTLLGPSTSEINSAANTYLYLDGEPKEFNAIQGVAVAYDINGNTTVQVNDLDLNNRLYFNDNDIAENGIFITNIDQENFGAWVRKDNLAVENLGNTYYSFGVLPGSNQCYIEFPEDAATLFKNGISIVYIRTMGKDGNIPLRRLEKFYNDITTVIEEDGQKNPIALNTEVVEVINNTSGTGGSDKESLNDAYRGYKHTVGTFNTLITLRDYINAILNGPELASNAIVTDRTNDIQCSYKVMTSINNISSLINKIDNHNNTQSLSAYNVKIYALQYASATIDNLFNYNNTFELQNDTELSVIRNYFESQKAIPHDFSAIRTPEQNSSDSYELWGSKPYDWDEDCTQYYMQVIDPDTGLIVYEHVPAGTEFEEDTYYYYDPYFISHYCMFKYLYPIECDITTTRTLDDEEKKEVINNIRAALYDKLNSKKLDFGESLSEYNLAQIITESDENISYVNMKNTVGQIYVTYWNGKRFITLNLSDSSENTPYLYNYSDPKFEDVEASPSFMSSIGYKAWGLYTFKCIRESGAPVWAMSKIEGNDSESSFVRLSDEASYFILNLRSTSILNTGDWFSIEINPIDLFKNEIFVKSVLQGITPLFINDTDFNYDINQVETEVGVVEDIEKIECNVTIPFTAAKPYYTLRDNESLKFYTSNLIDGNSYSNYVKYYYVSPRVDSTIEAGTNRELEENEYLFLFYKTTENPNDLYEYECYASGNIICPSFTLTIDNNSITNTIFREIADNVVDVSGKYSNNPRKYASTRTYRGLKASENDYVLKDISNWLSSNKIITTKFTNSLTLPSNYQYYWVLNNVAYYQPENGEAYYKYVLFDDYSEIADYRTSVTYKPGQKVKYNEEYYECIYETSGSFDSDNWKKLPAFEYTLDTNEYLFYKTSASSTLNILGAGTRILRDENTEWSVKAASIASINNNSDVLNDIWFIPNPGTTISIVEQQYTAIGAGATVLLQYKDQQEKPNYNINSNEYLNLDAIENIYYTFDNLSDDEKLNPSFYTPLPNLSNIDSWRAISTLFLTLGDDEEQILFSNQQVNLIQKDGNSIVIDGEDPSENSDRYPQVIQSYHPIEAISSSVSIIVYDVDEDGNKIYNKIYNYAKLKNVTDPSRDRIIYNDVEGGATVFFPTGDFTTEPHDIDLTFKIPPASGISDGYIFSIYNPHDNLTTAALTASLSNDDGSFSALYPIGTKTDYNLNKPGTYFFNVDIDSDNEKILRLSLGGFIAFEESSITINKLYKYHKPEDLTDSKFNDYVSLLSKFDPDRQFQYTYQVPENNMIENPLDSDSFLNPHHIYNSFTMYQHNVAKEKFNITSLR